MVLDRVISLYGPTAVGKTALGELLAASIDGEIINMDMGQMYVPFTIGTAKPAWQATCFSQHLFDLIDKPVSYDVAQYRQEATAVALAIRSRNHIPLFVGGSGFYCSSLFFKLTSAARPPVQLSDQEVSWQHLAQIDPERAQAIHPHDTYRIRRALECSTAGILASAQKPSWNPIARQALLGFVTRERDELVSRIEQRVDAMFEAGLLEEVMQLPIEWKRFALEKKIIGYAETIDFLEGRSTFDAMREQLVIRTRQYAKRQMSYGRMLMRQLAEHPTVECVEINLSRVSAGTAVQTMIDLAEALP